MMGFTAGRASWRSVRLAIVGVVLSVFAIVAGCSNDSAEEPPAELVDIKATRKVSQLWSTGLGGDAQHLRLALRPVVADEVVYAASHEGEVMAVSATNGRRLWTVKTKLPLSAGPEVNGSMLVVASSDGDVVALDSAKGTELWRRSLGSEVLARPIIVGDVVIVRTVDGHLEALSVTDGANRWNVDESVPRLTLRGTAPPVHAGDRIVVGFDNGRVLALDPRSGEVLWDTVVNAPSGRTELERLSDIDAPAHVSGSDVFVVGFQGRIAMLALDSGQIWWARDASSYRGFALDEQNIYLTNSDGVVMSMRRIDGAVQWEQDSMKRRALTAPAIDGDALVVGDFEGYVHWLDKATGQIVARHKTDGDRISNAAVASEAGIFLQTDSGKLVAFKSRMPEPQVAETTEPEQQSAR
jgi:outer membrane protein assembly factor BamB